LGEAWKLDLAAPPAEGKANEECVRFLAELAGVPRSRVRVVSGRGGAHQDRGSGRRAAQEDDAERNQMNLRSAGF
jgi:hypothetical protein